MDWLPISAAALVTGGTALFFGAQMTPRPGGDGDLLRRAQTEGDNWLALAVLLTLAAIGLVVGLPAIFTLFQRKGFRTGLLASVLLATGAVMLAGFAQQLLLFRTLAGTPGAVTEQTIAAVADNDVQLAMLGGGFVIFYVGELVLALALFRGGLTPLWVPLALVAHVALALVSARFLPDGAQSLSAILLTAALAGAGVTANRIGDR